MGTTPKSNTAFRDASGQPKTETGALVVDVQLGTLGRMSPADADAYLTHLGKSLESMRAKNIPITWATVGTEDGLFTPKDGNLPLSEDALIERGFFDNKTTLDENDPVQMRLLSFLKSHGPRANEAVLMKTALGSFDGNSLLHTQLQSQGTKDLLVMGTVSSRCVLETGLGGVRNGYKTSILSDLVVSWTGAELTSPLGWRGQNHRANIHNALNDPARGYSVDDQRAAAAISFTNTRQQAR